MRFGAAADRINQSFLNNSPLRTWIKGVKWSINNVANQFAGRVKWLILMAAGIIGFLPVPKAFQHYVEGHFLLGPRKMPSLFSQRDESLRAHILKRNFELSDYQSELRRSGLGFTPQNDKVPMQTWYIPAKTGQPCIIFSHGRGTNIAQQEGLLKGFKERGYGILIYEYPNLSLSDGRATEQRLYKAGLAASLYAKQQLKIPVSRQVIMGNSLGSIIAANTVAHLKVLSPKESPKALIMVSTFPTLQEAFISYRNRMGVWGKFLDEKRLTVQLDARSALKQNKDVPVLLLQGAQDKSTPLYMAEEMRQCIHPDNQAAKKLVAMPLTRHKLKEADYPFIVQQVDGFLHTLN